SPVTAMITSGKTAIVNRAGERCATSSIRSRTRTRCSRAPARRLRPSSSALSTRSGSTTLRTLGAGDDRCLLCHAGRARGRGNTDTVTCMSVSVTLPWSESLLGYDFGVGHPRAPVRLRLTVELLEALGLLADPGLHLVDAPVAEDGVLTAVHEAAYVRAVRAASTGTPDRARGLGTDDDPIFPGMHEASARIVGATVAGARAVWQGGPAHAVSLAGGMHHAMPSRAVAFLPDNELACQIA